MLSPYDPALVPAELVRDWRRCEVTGVAPLTVREGVLGDPVAAVDAVGNWQLALGDVVRVQRAGADLLVTHLLTPRPTRGTVLGVVGGVVTVEDADGVEWDLSHVGVAPSTGQVVRIMWDREGGTVVGVVTAATPAAGVAPVSPDVAPVLTSLDVRPTDWGTYRGSVRDYSNPGLVMQGYWTGYSSFGAKTGLWVYGDVLGGVAGKTCTALSVDLTRAPGVGQGAAVTIHLWLHAEQTMPGATPALIGPEHGGVSIAAGGGGTYPLPVAWGTALAAGTAAGIGVYYATDADYAGLYGPDVAGSGTLHGTWT